MEQVVRPGSKHCEDECDFPSSCHWKEQHAVQETDLGFLGPSCLDKGPDASSAEGKLTVQKSTGSYIGKPRKAAEKRTIQIAKALLAPIEEEDQRAASSLDTTPTFNGLGLHFPVMDFSSSKNGINKSCELVNKVQVNLSIPKSPQVSARVDNVREDDVDMMDWITQDVSESAPVSPWAQPDANEVPFNFRLEQDHSLPASLADDDSPISPTRSAWNWTAGGIGLALSPPALPVEEEIWEDEMMDEIDGADMLWDRGETVKRDSVDRRLST